MGRRKEAPRREIDPSTCNFLMDSGGYARVTEWSRLHFHTFFSGHFLSASMMHAWPSFAQAEAVIQGGRKIVGRLRRHLGHATARQPSIGRRRRSVHGTHGIAASAEVCSDFCGSKPFANCRVSELLLLSQVAALPPSAHGEQCCSSLGSWKLALLTTLLRWLISRYAGAFASVLGSFVFDELRRRWTISPSRWRASRVCASSRSRDARVMCRSRVMPCGLVCDHFYPKYTFGAPVSFCARPQLAPLHAVTGLPAHYFPHPL